MDLNVFDFQGERANEDFELICDLLENMPLAYLLLQVSDHTYVERLRKALENYNNGQLIEKFKDRVIAVSRSAENSEAIQDEVLNTFDIDEDGRFYDISDLSK